MTKLSQDEVLIYQKGRRPQKTVRHHFIKWREQQNPPIPMRCDMPNCIHNKILPPKWNGKDLNLILDHKNGVSGDNRIENLQFLCPNCNSQQPTNGGRNKDKVEQSKGGFAKIREDGKKDYTLPVEPRKFTITGGN